MTFVNYLFKRHIRHIESEAFRRHETSVPRIEVSIEYKPTNHSSLDEIELIQIKQWYVTVDFFDVYGTHIGEISFTRYIFAVVTFVTLGQRELLTE